MQQYQANYFLLCLFNWSIFAGC